MTVTGDPFNEYGTSGGRFSELLDLVYECVLSPKGWETALGAVCRDLDLMQAVLGYYVTATGAPLMRKQYGMDRVWFERMPEFGIEMANFWGGPDRVRAYPIGEAVVHTIAQPDFDYSTNRFAKDWCAPQGIADFLAMTVAADQTGMGTLVFNSNRKLGGADFEPGLALIRALSPHIRRVVAISSVLDLKTVEAASFQATLDALPNGIALVDADARVIHANAAAAARLQSRDEVRLVEGRVNLSEEPATRALLAAVKGSGDAATLGHRGIAVPTSTRAGRRSIVHVLPLKHGGLREGLRPNAVAALFMTSAQGTPKVPSDALSLLYHLTPAEVRVCELIAEGDSPAAIATRIGVASSTVRTHLLRIFDKTGAHRQADLVRLVSALAVNLSD